MPNSNLENIILQNPGVPVRQISKMSGVGISQVMKVKCRLKKSAPEVFGLQNMQKINERGLCEVADQVLNGMSDKERRGFLRAIVKGLLSKGTISYEDAEEMGITN